MGPGRAWVDYARALAESGYTSIRLDFSGWGESPDLGHAPGRPYDAHCVDEIASVVDDLRADGHDRVVVAGLCAGAWVALRAAVTHRPRRGDRHQSAALLVARRPGGGRHRQGDARPASGGDPPLQAGRRAGAWSALDVIGVRHPAADWLRDLDAGGTPVLALFAEGDDGLEFLEDRVGRTWSRSLRRGVVTCRVVPGIDHPMHRTWLRASVVDEVRGWLDGLDRPSVGPAPSER